jgi:hypothetical protein
MSWIDDKKILTDALSGYTEIQNNIRTKEAAETKAHKSYTITLGTPDVKSLINQAYLSIRKVRLEINYRQKDNLNYDMNCEEFENIQTTISGLSPFVSFVTITPPERWDEKVQQSTAIFEFYYGVKTCR